MKMQWEKLLTKKRFSNNDKEEKLYDDPCRCEFQKDYDRIAFSPSYRRLGKKTQVHPLSSNDHIHTRITHSQEVASSGRSLGAMAGKYLMEQYLVSHKIINVYECGTLVQAASLAHDIGNPPFGHAGEEAIRTWFKEHPKFLEGFSTEEKNDFLYWEGNAQALRVVTKIENDYFDGGMKLTYAVLGSFMKYPYISHGEKTPKFGCFWSERKELTEIALALGLIKYNDYSWKRHPFAFLSEAADDICYSMTDIEDAHELKILSYKEIQEIFKNFINHEDFSNYEKRINNEAIFARRRLSLLRAIFINSCLKEVMKEFEKNIDVILEGGLDVPLTSLIREPEKSILEKISEVCRERVFTDQRKIELEIAVHSIMDILLTNFCTSALELTQGKSLSFKTKKICDLMGETAIQKDGTTFDAYHRVLDYISGMTDNYAAYMATQFSGSLKI